LLNGESDNWFGPIITPNADTIQNISAESPFDDGSTQAIVKVRLQGLTDTNHLVNVSFNNVQLGTVDNNGKANREMEFTVPMSAVVNGNNQISLRSVGASNDISLVDTVSLRYTRSYMAHNSQIRFTVPANQTVRVGGFDDNGIQVFEIGSDGGVVREVGVDVQKVNRTAGFVLSRADYDREFLAVYQRQFSRTVSRIEANNPSSWNSTQNSADFIILTPTVFRQEAETLAQRRSAQGWGTVVVNVEDVYDEYSFGVRSVEAIRSFLEDASSNWTLKPRYVLLFGDSSYDQRNYLNQTNRDLIPTKLFDTQFMETSSDGWLADFDDDGIEDLAIGRLPVGTQTEAANMLAKLLRYDQQGNRNQRSSLLVSDYFFESYGDILEDRLPGNVSAMRINRSQMSDSQMRSDIIAMVQLNPMVVTYNGHGTTGVWANANVLRDTDVPGFANDKLAFFMLMTCLNGYSHNAYSDSLSEAFIKAQNGAIAVWSSSGSTYASGQIYMSQQATDDLFTQNPLPIGDLTRTAKQTTTDLDARRTWQLIGDPTIVIK
jgi:hypothetical protein